ncbi:hypothetical protein ACFY1L_00605 [Streptomyces sp. NPDC001663]|uniref:hypothetical protein n=1 Tax=Streptomyces sp. NPDC001663 TaxID=3364597 RepID=UPI00369185AE
MADGQPIIQGSGANKNNTEDSATQLVNHAQRNADGTGLYLFGAPSDRESPGGDGLYSVSFRGSAVRGYSYNGDGVYGASRTNGAGVHGVSSTGTAVYGQDTGNGTGVQGNSPGGVGVRGSGSGAGVIGEASDAGGFGVEGINRQGLNGGYGVLGYARTGVWGDGSIGVIGRGLTQYGIGVEGDALGEGGIGVFGATSANAGGIGVYATAPNPGSTALQVRGSAVFSSGGRVTVPAGSDRITVTGPTLGPASMVLATVQQDTPGIAVRAAVPDPAAGSFTVFLTQTSATETAVAWFVIN